MDFWTAHESRPSSHIYQSTVISPVLAKWLFLGINESPESWVQQDAHLNWSLVQLHQSVQLVQKNTNKLTVGPLLVWINESPEYWISELIISPVDQSRNMSSVRTQCQLLWIHRHFTSYYTCSGASICKKMCKVDFIRHDESEASRFNSWYECQVDHRRGVFSVTHIQRRHLLQILIILRISNLLKNNWSYPPNLP